MNLSKTTNGKRKEKNPLVLYYIEEISCQVKS
jgi:hypothetical protein